MTAERGVISYPIPPYSNVPIQAGYFQPSRFVISAISLGYQTLVTTTANMNYVIGQLIRLLIPPQYGSVQLNEQEAYVLSLPAANQVLISIDSSRNVNAFIASPTIPINTAYAVPQIVAVGDINNGIISSTGRSVPTTSVPGSFINISPL